MARKGYNIYKRKDGRWEGRLFIERSCDGRNKYRSVYGKTYKAVKEKMMLEALKRGDSKTAQKLRMKDILEIWLAENKITWKASTYACYYQLVYRQIVPDIGRVPMSAFEEKQLHLFIAQKQKQGNLFTGTGLSASYLQSICSIVIQALKYVKKTRNIDYTVPELPAFKKEIRRQKLPTELTLSKLESHLRTKIPDTTALGILLCMYTGVRIGELCALQWKDIDIENKVITIHKTLQRTKAFHETGMTDSKKTELMITEPKTVSAFRNIPIPFHMLTLLEPCKGKADDYVLSGKSQPYMEVRTLQYRFQAILKACEIPAFNFHMLRHIFATRCIAAGFDMKSLSEILGHANIKITMGIYVHTSGERKKRLMDQLLPYVA